MEGRPKGKSYKLAVLSMEMTAKFAYSVKGVDHRLQFSGPAAIPAPAKPTQITSVLPVPGLQ